MTRPPKTERNHTIVELIREGMSAKEIARQFNLKNENCVYHIPQRTVGKTFTEVREEGGIEA